MIRVLILLIVTLPFMAPRRASAVIFDTLTTYYTGSCPNGLVYNGYKWKECSGTVTQSGTLSGTWRCDDVYDCDEGTIVYSWYERCNNAWVYRYSVGPYEPNQWPDTSDCHCT
ncbi:MAG: hypothetical protein ABI779_19465 [Acidobacteriota bacterium]